MLPMSQPRFRVFFHVPPYHPGELVMPEWTSPDDVEELIAIWANTILHGPTPPGTTVGDAVVRTLP